VANDDGAQEFVMNVMKEAVRAKGDPERPLAVADLLAAVTQNPLLLPPDISPLVVERLLCSAAVSLP